MHTTFITQSIPQATRSDRRAAGFSLVELMVVIVILGMMFGTVVLNWKALVPKQRLHSAVRELSDVLHECRSEAISRNRAFELYYDLDEERYWVRTPYRLEGGLAQSEEDARRIVHESNLTNDELELVSITIDEETYTDGLALVRFEPLGASSSHRIVLYQPMFDLYYTIEMMPLTGEIRFHEGIYEREPAQDRDFD
ncbi:MAG: prepilin-type N-terminal cleavage/methylation domain-containing protein [Planctomycetota bacterium]